MPVTSDATDGSRLSKGSMGRRILINRQQEHKYKSNQISTAKYNVFTFVPKFLYEQFRRYANIFFLCIGLLQQIPDVSPTGKYVTIVPLFLILLITALKELFEDIKRHNADKGVNLSHIEVLNSAFGTWESKQWKDVKVGDIVKVVDTKFFPADLILLASSEPQGMCYIETANLDGETNLKIRSSLEFTSRLTEPVDLRKFTGTIETELPNRQLYEFVGNITPEGEQANPLSSTQLLLRGARLMNTQWIYGVVVYTGHESKLLMNSTKAPLKRSNIDKITNYQIIFLFFILVCLALISAIANEVQSSNGEDHMSYIGPLPGSQFGWNFLTFFILYNNLIPISMQVSLDMVKLVQAYFINWDEEMHHVNPDTKHEAYAMARTSNLNEELGQIKYVFSDKTGTLTCNIMVYKKCTVAGVIFDAPEKMEYGGDASLALDLVKLLGNGSDQGRIIKDFLVVLSVCHTVIPEKGEDGNIVNYNAASPDEKALVEGAALYGFEFINRTHDTVIIRTPSGEEETYEILNVIEFTSTRKRMSVIVKNPLGEIKLYIKGADTMILERLAPGEEQTDLYFKTIEHLETFARTGLRTLCLAVVTIPQQDYQEWAEKWQQASTSGNSTAEREKNIEDVATLIERDLKLLGATAIEDRLQDEVPETIEKMLLANIHVWVLTGDKQETAINIGKSCRLLQEGMDLIILNADSLEESKKEISENLKLFQEKGTVGQSNPAAVIIDGKSLMHALHPDVRKNLIDLCTSCKSVICCRVSPIQKAEMVQLVREHTGAISLAIGDGANDVAMIQKADVGVGISGNEGLQAANSADFAIGQFRFLARLLFVHGAWNYSRNSKVILYSFYKNITLYVIELWFAIYNYWSGQVIYERWTIGMYNILFTFLPPIALGLFDKNCVAKTREANPSLYLPSQKGELFNHKVFWKWIGNSIFHSALLFWIPMFTMKTGVTWHSGNSDGYLVLGNTVYTVVVVTTCLKAGLEMDAWTWVNHASIWGSIGLWFVFLVVYSNLWPTIPFAANMTGMINLLFSNPNFWGCLILVPTLTLLLDVTVRAVQATVFKTETDVARIEELGRTASIGSCFSLKKKRKLAARGGSQNSIELAEVTRRGYAFSQEERGAVSQSEYIRRYDTRSSKLRQTV